MKKDEKEFDDENVQQQTPSKPSTIDSDEDITQSTPVRPPAAKRTKLTDTPEGTL